MISSATVRWSIDFFCSWTKNMLYHDRFCEYVCLHVAMILRIFTPLSLFNPSLPKLKWRRFSKDGCFIFKLKFCVFPEKTYYSKFSLFCREWISLQENVFRRTKFPRNLYIIDENNGLRQLLRFHFCGTPHTLALHKKIVLTKFTFLPSYLLLTAKIFIVKIVRK